MSDRQEGAGQGVPGSAPRAAIRSAMGAGPEFDLIRGFLDGAPLHAPGVRVGAGDDCAVVAGAGIALSSDLAVEGVHFRREWLRPDEIGYRAAAAALSDLAAAAARPIGILVSLALPARDRGLGREIMEGAVRAVSLVGGALLGGDLTRSLGGIVIDVTAVGEVDGAILRSGARPGDEVWVTGELGAAGLAVARLLAGDEPPAGAFDRFATPVPRIPEALRLRQMAAVTAMLDLSDGLAGDAGHLAAASGVALVLEPDTIPVHPAVRAALSAADALHLAVTGGEDYELLFCAAADRAGDLRAAFDAGSVSITRVGRVEEGDGVHWRTTEGGREPVGALGFQHFDGET